MATLLPHPTSTFPLWIWGALTLPVAPVAPCPISGCSCMRSVVLVGWGSRDQAHKMCTNRKMVLFWVGTPQPPTYFATMYTASLMANALHFDPPPLESPRLGRWTGGRQPPQQEGHTLAALHSSPCPVDLLGAMTTSRKLVVSSRAAIKLLPNEDAPCRGCSNSRATTKRGCTMSPGRARAPPSLRASSDAHQLWKVQAHGTCHFFGWLVLDLL